jgi:hypothetical protein
MYRQWPGEKKFSDCQRIVAYNYRSCALQQDAQEHLSPANRQQSALLRVATAPKANQLREAEVEDQAPAASLVSQVVSNLHVAASLARVAVSPCWMRMSDRVSSREEEKTEHRNESNRAPWMHPSGARACVVAVKSQTLQCFVQPHLANLLLLWTGRGTGTSNLLELEVRMSPRVGPIRNPVL